MFISVQNKGKIPLARSAPEERNLMLQQRPGFRAGPFSLVEGRGMEEANTKIADPRKKKAKEREKMTETASGEYKVTFTLSNLTPMVYDRIDGYATNEERFNDMLKLSKGDLRHTTKMKIGASNAFNERVAVNSIVRKPKFVQSYKLEKRKGYNLATFIVK